MEIIESPSLGRRISGGESGSPTCRAPQDMHTVEAVSRVFPQHGQIMVLGRDFSAIVFFVFGLKPVAAG
jgi:hypothetical protein